MAHLQHLWSEHSVFLLCLPPILYFLGGVGGQLSSIKKLSVSRAWRLAGATSAASLFISVACCVNALVHATSPARVPRIDSLFDFGVGHFSLRFDRLELLMLLLVAFLGWIIVRYSRSYMAGDPNEATYIANLMRTLAAVGLLVVTNSLIVFLVAWILTGLSIHGLLTLYPNRQAAVIAAHKKFLASRLGDLTLLCGVLLLGSQTGSFEMDGVLHRIAEFHRVPRSIHVAVFLIAISAIIKCAQLPLHGWLIQVMEAPTPVSALLHAGVVNLGGFMLIRLAPAIDSTPAAQKLLVVVGCSTAIISSLVMTTRISIKVNLAWSTCAQMGFMLMECGLGLYGLAFMHLLGHSLYKAHAFLGSGGAVGQAKLKLMTPPSPTAGVPKLLGSALFGLLVSTIASTLFRTSTAADGTLLFCIPVVGLAIAGILSAAGSKRSALASLGLLGSAAAICVLYFGYDSVFQRLLPPATNDPILQRPLVMFTLGCFVLLYGVQTIVRVNPLGPLATALYPWFFAGLYLDEVFTRATFRIWPANGISQVQLSRDATQPFQARGESL